LDSSPVRLPQLALEDLAGSRFWQRLITQLDRLRNLVARDQRAAVCYQLLGIDRRSRHDDCVNRLAPTGIGDTEDRRLADSRMAIKGLFDLRAVHVLPTGHDHVLGSVDEINEPIIILIAEVPGV